MSTGMRRPSRARRLSELGLIACLLGCASQPPRSPEAAPEELAEPAVAAESPATPEHSVAAADTAAAADTTATRSTTEGPANPTPSPAGAAASGPPSTEFDQDIANIEKLAGVGPGQSQAPSGREIVYRVSSGELTVDLGGLTLKPKAKTIKRDNGSYVVELEVVASSKDGQRYQITSPSKRPLSIAGEVVVRSDETQRFADERKGEGELIVQSNDTLRFRQSWPAKGQPKLWGGQKATLEVGLWGVRGEDERERPVKRLFIIKVSASAHPTALIMPPDVVASE
jgi:hypothetical protein